MNKPAPDLSVIIPTLNEDQTLPGLLKDLAAQQGLCLEILVVDGGSADSTTDQCLEFSQKNDISLTLLQTRAGRGHQQNCGAQAAKGNELLFLHADTRLQEQRLLANALLEMQKARKTRQTVNIAGHFGLQFMRSNPGNDAAYYFYEAKTFLNRAECINGDQGIMVSRRYFDSLGRFDESLPFMEDARLARKIFQTGQWITLPGRLGSSARRFQSEGLQERQTLNAFLRNFDAIGFDEFFSAAADAYRARRNPGRLCLKPVLLIIHKLVCARGLKAALTLWYKTGKYVANNGWQLAFALDCRRNHRRKFAPGTGPTSGLATYDKWFAPLLTTPPGNSLTGLFTLIWFYSYLVKSLLGR